MNRKKIGPGVTSAILSLSLLTVMAGAAVAPALNTIQEYFSGTNSMLVQMIISIPALFIVITSLVFPALCRKFGARTLLLAGLLLYTVGGCIAGLFSNIYLLLAMRALVGIGVGIVMPMSTGLLAFYFEPSRQDRLMGYSSALNQLGGSVATLLSGLLATITWRISFLVYLMGLISIVLTLIFMPNDNIGQKKEKKEQNSGTFRTYYPFIIAMFLLMFIFFIYPADFAIETAKEGVIPQSQVAVIMALMDALGFAGGLAYSALGRRSGLRAKYVTPLLFLISYALLAFVGGYFAAIVGSVLIGAGSGFGIPFLISTASKRAGKTAGTTVLPLISAALYLAQFLTPVILSTVEAAFGGLGFLHLPYVTAVAVSVFFFVWQAVTIRSAKRTSVEEKQETEERLAG